MNAIDRTPPPAQHQSPADDAKQEIVGLRSEFEKMLGGAIGVERFERAVLTAIQRDPDLVALPRDSLVSAGLKAAQDRLLPDGREGVFLARWNAKSRRKEVTWAPMVYGIVKVAKQYAGVRSLSCEVVYEGEPFRILLGDEMRIEHERIVGKVKNGAEVGCYAIATFADGAREREFMTAQQIMEVEAASESAKKGFGPWKTWRGEMMRKSVIRRLSKKLPAMDEGGEALRRVIERVDDDYSFGHAPPVFEFVETGGGGGKQFPDADAWRAFWRDRLKVMAADKNLAAAEPLFEANARHITAVEAEDKEAASWVRNQLHRMAVAARAAKREDAEPANPEAGAEPPLPGGMDEHAGTLAIRRVNGTDEAIGPKDGKTAGDRWLDYMLRTIGKAQESGNAQDLKAWWDGNGRHMPEVWERFPDAAKAAVNAFNEAFLHLPDKADVLADAP